MFKPHDHLSPALQTVTLQPLQYHPLNTCIIYLLHVSNVTISGCMPAPVTNRTACYTWPPFTFFFIYSISNATNRYTYSPLEYIYITHLLQPTRYSSFTFRITIRYTLDVINYKALDSPLYLNYPVHASVTFHSLQLCRYNSNVQNVAFQSTVTNPLHLSLSSCFTTQSVAPHRYKPLHFTRCSSMHPRTRHICHVTKRYWYIPSLTYRPPVTHHISRYATTDPLLQ